MSSLPDMIVARSRHVILLAVGLLGAALLTTPSIAQTPTVPLQHPLLAAALDSIGAWQSWTFEQQIDLTEIEAPPFKEARRAAEFRRKLIALGYAETRIDAEGNVIAPLAGDDKGPVVVVSAHLDTVFPEGTDVSVTRTGRYVAAPGIADDSRGLAVVLTVARAFKSLGLEPRGTVLFVGTVGEEGEGNLRGVRHLFVHELANRIDYFISVDGTGYGITNAAVGSIRYRVTFRGPGGHSYGSFGMPNPMHAMGRAIATIADFDVPADPKTTFSVSVADGGTSVNSIPMAASFEIDMRSAEPSELEELNRRVLRALNDALAAEKDRWSRSGASLELQLDTIGIRPAGRQPSSAPIVRAALAAAQALGQRSILVASSTDANIPISMGIPAVTIDGGGRGGDSHTLNEWYEDTRDAYKGPQWAALIVAMLAGLN